MIEEQQIYLLLEKYFEKNTTVNRYSVALDLLSLVGCQNLSLIQSICNGCEHDKYTLFELRKMIECYEKSDKN